MDLDSKMDNIKNGTLEVVTEEELKEKLNKDRPVAYIGYEPSGNVHLGHAITVKKMIDLQNAGFKVKILLADLHAYLNGKGSLEEIEEISKYNMKCFRALGLSENYRVHTRFKLPNKRGLHHTKYTNSHFQQL